MGEKVEKDSVFDKIAKGIEKFNKFRNPEARAELVSIAENQILIRFSGHMCYTCGTYDYFEDLLYEIRDLGVEIRIKDWQMENESYLVLYEIAG